MTKREFIDALRVFASQYGSGVAAYAAGEVANLAERLFPEVRPYFWLEPSFLPEKFKTLPYFWLGRDAETL